MHTYYSMRDKMLLISTRNWWKKVCNNQNDIILYSALSWGSFIESYYRMGTHNRRTIGAPYTVKIDRIVRFLNLQNNSDQQKQPIQFVDIPQFCNRAIGHSVIRY